MIEVIRTRFKIRTFVFFVLCLLGCVPGLSAWGSGGHLQPLAHNMCPSEDTNTHECFRMTTQNATCLVFTFDCIPFLQRHCQWGLGTEQVPCTVYKCEHEGCCDGWTEDEDGICRADSISKKVHCLNNGWKANNDDLCNCPSRFTGEKCETPLCEEPCLHGGKCELVDGEPQCVCPSKFYSQPHCEQVKCEKPCENGGTCVPDGVLSRCKCKPGFQGQTCQYEVNIQCPLVMTDADKDSCSSIDKECMENHDCVSNQICCYNGCGGECVNPSNRTCLYNNVHYGAGETFSPESCKRCVCQPRGDWQCTEVTCPTTECDGGHTPISIDGHCCKICPDTEITEDAGPEFENCPARFVTINVGEDGQMATLPVNSLGLKVESHDGTSLGVSYSRTRFAHSMSANMKENMHIVTAYSDCDSNGRRAECSFMVIVRDPYSPVFTTCPMEIFALDNEEIDWSDPVATDNIGISRIQAEGDEVRKKVLKVGTYTVSYTVWDYDQNQAICAFAIHVLNKDKDPQTLPKEIKKRRHDGFVSMPTIIGVVLGLTLFIVIGLYVAIYFFKRGSDNPHLTENPENNIYAVLGHGNHSYENVGKLPLYSPPMNPPPYEEVDHSFETPPIYEEITNDRSVEEHCYANIDIGHSNPSFQEDSGGMKYMKL